MEPLGDTSNAQTSSTIPKKQAKPVSNGKDPYGDYDGLEAGMLSLAAENKNKRKIITLTTAKKRKHTTDFVGPAAPTNGRLDSPQYEPGEPSVPVASPSASPEVEQRKGRKGKNKKQQRLSNGSRRLSGNGHQVTPPSERTDLPPNIVVTAFDVDVDSWVPGQVEKLDGTSVDWKGWSQQLDWVPEPPVKDVREEDGEDTLARRFPRLAKLEQKTGKVGQQVAIQYLELDTETFTPALVTKFGTLVAVEPFARVELDPSCRSLPQQAEDEVFYDEADEEYDERYAPKPKFGMPLPNDDDDEEGGNYDGRYWEGDWAAVDIRAMQS